MNDFFVIHGTYHLTNRTAAGRATGFEPDGDSIHFKPADPALLGRLTQLRRPVTLTNIGSTQLRFEGVDALELHYQAGGPETRQPRPLADQARDFLTGLLGLNPVPYAPPALIRVKPPVERDAAPGFILARSLEVNGRPVSLAFAGEPPAADGATLALTAGLAKRSLNHKLLLTGQAYPLFYDGLPLDVRRTFTTAAQKARGAKLGLWRRDLSVKGLAVAGLADLEARGVIFPKLFRRLVEFFGAQPARPLAEFRPWLAAEAPERVLDVREVDFLDFSEIVQVRATTVRLTRRPEELVFVSAR